jgi:hypothetical protein
MADDWSVFSIYYGEGFSLDDIQRLVDLCKSLNERDLLDDFFFNKYGDHVRFGFKNSTEKSRLEFGAFLKELQESMRVSKTEETKPDLSNVDGIIMDDIKCVSRELRDTVTIRFGKTPTTQQESYLIHFMMNQSDLCLHW